MYGKLLAGDLDQKAPPQTFTKGEGGRQNAGAVKVICFYMSMKPYYYCFTCQAKLFLLCATSLDS